MSALEAEFRVELRDFDLEVGLRTVAGERLALVGPSGAGKTTALRAVSGLTRPDAGSITLGRETWFDANRRIDIAPEQRRCGFVFQDYALFPAMSASRNVEFGALGRGRKARRARAAEVIERFGISHLADAPVRDLSGGERQRVALARALAADPSVLLLDEPLAALDPTSRSDALHELDSMLRGLGVPIVIVTHSYEEAALLADIVAVIERGRVVQAGSPAEISAQPASPFVAGFAGASVIIGEASSEGDGLTLVRLRGGGLVRSTDTATGPVAASIYPWEVSLEPPGTEHSDSALNRLAGDVTSVTEIANRVRVGVALPQPLTVEITARSLDALDLRPGARVVAAWKATATRLVPR